MKGLQHIVLCLLAVGVVCPISYSQAVLFDTPLGEFTNQASIGDDWGEDLNNKYADGTYEILGSGNDIWNAADGCFFVYKEYTGNFIATVEMEWGDQELPGGDALAGNEWKKMGIMLREDPENPGSRHGMAILREDYGADLQARQTTNGSSTDTGLIGKAADENNVIQLMRVGGTFTMYRGLTAGGYRTIGTLDVADFPDTAYLGLVITAHDVNNLERAFFKNFSIKTVSIGASVTRTLPAKSADTGTSMTGVKLAVAIETGKTADAKIVETIPAGWTVSNIKASIGTATLEAGVITWTIPKATGTDANLTYDLQVPNQLGTYRFVGSINVGADEFSAGGDSVVSVLPPATSLGVFTAHEDIFNTESTLGAVGDARYDPNSNTYIVLGSGHDIWDSQDDFHFLYTKVTGDCSMIATVELDAGDSTSTWAKAGIMLRDELTADSPHAFSMIRLDGRDFAPQWRPTWGSGGNWEGDAALIDGGTAAGQQSGTIGLEYTVADNKVAFTYYDSVSGERVEWRTMDTIDFTDENYLGLCVTSHESGSISMGTFTNISMVLNGTPVGIEEWFLY